MAGVRRALTASTCALLLFAGVQPAPKKQRKPRSAPRAPAGPPGGISQVTTGGVSVRLAGD